MKETHRPVFQRILLFIRQNAIALTALFVSLGGASYAAIKIPAHSVGTKQLRNGSVTSKKLAKQAVTAAKLDSTSIAGHIADWAQISADGHVNASRPRATVFMSNPQRGVFILSWKRSIPAGCIANANPTNVIPTHAANASVFALNGHVAASNVIVSTFDANGNNVPENVNVEVICP